MNNIVSQSDRIVSRANSILGIESRSSADTVTEADAETEKKKKDKIAEINTEIDRRKTAFEIV